jgi:hypothetical protein
MRSLRTVFGSTLTSRQARLWETECFSIALCAASRFSWGVVSSFPAGLSGRCCPTWNRLCAPVQNYITEAAA